MLSPSTVAVETAGVASAQSVKVEHDKTAHFASYKSYAWKADPTPGKDTEARYEFWEKQLAIFTDAFLKQAYETGWAGVAKLSPQHGPQMQKLFTKK